MKAIRKNPLSYAVGAVLAAMAVVPMSASAVSIDVDDGAFASDDGGDTLAYPIYSTVNGVTSSFSLTNTSDRSIAVKVRMREQQRSMDVWDTMVFLSPWDKWDFTVSASADPNTPQVNSVAGDTTCTTAPSFPSAFRQTGFNAEGWASGRATVGHVEVIGMMDLEDAYFSINNVPGIPPVSVGLLIETRECAALRSIFTYPVADYLTGALDVENVLIGRYVVGVNGGGLEAGDVPITLQDTFGEALLLSQSAIPDSRCATTTPANYPGNCMSTYAWDQYEEDHPHLGDIADGDFQNIDGLMTAANLQGDWSSNPANYVGTDWLASFFAKYVYTDWRNCDPTNQNTIQWCDVLPRIKAGYNSFPVGAATYVPNNPFSAKLVAAGPRELPATCLKIGLWGLDADENFGVGGISPNVQPQLCNEVSVIGIAADAATARPSLIQANTGPFARLLFGIPDLAAAGATRGWADLTLDWPANTTEEAVPGAAVGALLFMTRSEPSNPAASNASLVPLAHRQANN